DVRAYLLDNPAVIEEAMAELERQRTTAQSAARGLQVTANADRLFESERQVVIGNPEGTVTLVEFFDYNCTFCRGAVPDLLTLIAQNPDLRVVLKEFPILGRGSVEAAEVSIAFAELAPEQF